MCCRTVIGLSVILPWHTSTGFLARAPPSYCFGQTVRPTNELPSLTLWHGGRRARERAPTPTRWSRVYTGSSWRSPSRSVLLGSAPAYGSRSFRASDEHRASVSDPGSSACASPGDPPGSPDIDIWTFPLRSFFFSIYPLFYGHSG